MSHYQIQIRPQAKKSLDQLDGPLKKRIYAAITLLGENPFPPAARHIANSPYLRVRIGDYRILYHVLDDLLLIELIQIKHRKDAYRRMP
ncbi:MAG: type II toxin-antitoxin system RelE/ParE family toxin [Actinomycetes bacterium]